MKKPNYMNVNEFVIIAGWYEYPDGNPEVNEWVYTSFKKGMEYFKHCVNNCTGLYAIYMYRCEEDADGGLVGSGDPIVCFDRVRMHRKLEKIRKKKAR